MQLRKDKKRIFILIGGSKEIYGDTEGNGHSFVMDLKA